MFLDQVPWPELAISAAPSLTSVSPAFASDAATVDGHKRVYTSSGAEQQARKSKRMHRRSGHTIYAFDVRKPTCSGVDTTTHPVVWVNHSFANELQQAFAMKDVRFASSFHCACRIQVRQIPNLAIWQHVVAAG